MTPSPRLPLFFFRAQTEKPNVRRAWNLERDDYLTKPFTHQESLRPSTRGSRNKAELQRQSDKKLDELAGTSAAGVAARTAHSFARNLGLVSLMMRTCD